MNIGLGSVSFSTSCPGAACASAMTAASGTTAMATRVLFSVTARSSAAGPAGNPARRRVCPVCALLSLRRPGQIRARAPRSVSCSCPPNRYARGNDMDAKPGITRRRFIATTTAAAAGLTIVPRHVLGGPRFVAPSDKVNVGLIGAGGQGRTNARALFEEPNCQIIALADPAEEWDLSGWYFGGKSGRGPVRAEIEKHYAGRTPVHRCAVYEDFRVMLEKEQAIDAVLIATPDHLHAYASIFAMKAGKHVYCEKPLTHNVHEARLVARIAKETGVATQMGNQGRSSEGHRQTIEWLADGAIGAVREVHAWSGTARSAGRP